MEEFSKKRRGKGGGQVLFDPKNQLTKVTQGATIINYTYDSQGQRISKSSDTSFTLYPTKGYTIDNTGKKTVSIFSPLGMIANIETILGETSKVYTTTTDHLGSTVVVTDNSGIPVQVQDYETFGSLQLNDKSSGFNSQRKYIGETFDQDTGLNYLNARYYNSNIGRFISQDPMFWSLPSELLSDPQQLNSYSYVRNNPIVGSDPSGLIPEPGEAAVMANQIYQDGHEGDNLIGGWGFNSFLPAGDNLKIGIYSRTQTDTQSVPLEYALVGRGTRGFTNYSDWKNNIQQAFGASPDLSVAVSKAMDFVNNHPDNETTFVGHSKSGPEATASALRTNKNAIVFNSATLNTSAYKSEISQYTGHVDEYIVRGEILNSVFGSASVPFGTNNSVTYLPTQHRLSFGQVLMNGLPRSLWNN